MKIRILNTSLVELGTITETITANVREGLNSYKELQFETYLTAENTALITDGVIAEVNGDYYDIAYYKKDQKEDGSLDLYAEFEHVSYRLNDKEYDMEFFAETGAPAHVLSKILEGTGFTAGTVEFTNQVTYSIQEKSSRRKMLMEFISLLGGEVDFDRFQISILAHRGSEVPKNITEGKNFTVIAVTFDKRQRDSNGNPLVSYECKLINPMEINLGDVVMMQYGTLSINASLRVVSISKNPYNDQDVEFEIGNFNPALECDIYKIETKAVAKDKFYHGARIGPEYGFEVIRSDRKARAFLNSQNLAFQAGDGSGSNWTNKLYYDFDPETGEAVLVFDGVLSAEALDAIKATIDIVVSNTVIINNLYAARGYIAELTVDQLDTSDKVAKYLVSDTSDVNYIRIYNQKIEFITATTNGLTTEQARDRNGNPLYWLDETQGSTTIEETGYPVTIYTYDETIKLAINFELEGTDYIPKIVLGAGVGNEAYPNRGKGFVYKDTNGLLLKYITSDGVEYSIELGENGIIQNGTGLLSALDFYANGFTAEYGETSTGYRWTKDLDGRITELEDIHTGEIIPVTWNAGDI